MLDWVNERAKFKREEHNDVLSVTWNENEHIVIESRNADDELQGQLVAEEAGDAKTKVIHVHVERDLPGKFQLHG